MISNFKKKSKENPWRGIIIKGVAIFMLALAIVLIVSDVRVYLKKKELNHQIEKLQREVEEMQEKNEGLQEAIENEDNTTYMEKVAREELDLQKEGEKVVSFIEPQHESVANTETKQGFFQYWLGWVGNLFKK